MGGELITLPTGPSAYRHDLYIRDNTALKKEAELPRVIIPGQATGLDLEDSVSGKTQKWLRIVSIPLVGFMII